LVLDDGIGIGIYQQLGIKLKIPILIAAIQMQSMIEIQSLDRETINISTLVTGASLAIPLTLIGNSFPKKENCGIALVGLGYYSSDSFSYGL